MTKAMQTADFDYALPEELIAQEPAPNRTDARMLVLHREAGRIEHRSIADIGDYLQAGDLLVVNNTRVIRARIYGHKVGSGGAVDLLLLEPTEPGCWLALCRASHQPKAGAQLSLANGQIQAEVLRQGEAGRITIRLVCERPLLDILEEAGDVPLPPYIRRGAEDARRSADSSRYQTVYASQPGAVAAPTAGLHFTPALFADLVAKGIGKAEITLHVGIGTFRPVRADHVTDHRMDEERYEMLPAAAAAIRSARLHGGRIVAVGSTSVRTLETVMAREGEIRAGAGRSDLFIYPPYTFQAVDCMLTNFHLPKSTLIMMVSALAGRDLIMHAYAEAVRERYRFFSYGDCMLIL
ncbi:MAG: tRNA preQ1(34) S-adenosylmethionine ribosyltransferase-isomerase QueA [Kiritimatiellia bacterium]